MNMSGKPWFLRKAATVVAIGASSILLSVSAAHAAAPEIAVSPATGLTDGQSVAVNGEGFPAGESVAMVQCNAPADPAALSCNYADYVPAAADGAGAFSGNIVVRGVFDGINPVTGQPAGTVDCASGTACAIAVGSQADPSIFAPPAPIAFGS